MKRNSLYKYEFQKTRVTLKIEVTLLQFFEM
jgi:hypothetical protein